MLCIHLISFGSDFQGAQQFYFVQKNSLSVTRAGRRFHLYNDTAIGWFYTSLFHLYLLLFSEYYAQEDTALESVDVSLSPTS